MKNKLNYLVIHCTATPQGREVTKDDIIKWHTNPVHLGGRGWNRPGYGDMIYLDGKLINLIPFNTDDFVDLWEISNGVAGMNGNSRHIVYVGGMDEQNKAPKNTLNSLQTKSLETYVKYTILRHPQIMILGHNEAPNAKGKACPSFNVSEWLRSIGVEEVNIFHKSPEVDLAVNAASPSELEA